MVFIIIKKTIEPVAIFNTHNINLPQLINKCHLHDKERVYAVVHRKEYLYGIPTLSSLNPKDRVVRYCDDCKYKHVQEIDSWEEELLLKLYHKELSPRQFEKAYEAGILRQKKNRAERAVRQENYDQNFVKYAIIATIMLIILGLILRRIFL